MHKNRNINQKLADLYSFAYLYKKLILYNIYIYIQNSKMLFFFSKNTSSFLLFWVPYSIIIVW